MMVLPLRSIRIARTKNATRLHRYRCGCTCRGWSGVLCDGHFIQSNAQDVFVPAIDSITGGYRDFNNPQLSWYSITIKV